jgi:hypothetical protein
MSAYGQPYLATFPKNQLIEYVNKLFQICSPQFSPFLPKIDEERRG